MSLRKFVVPFTLTAITLMGGLAAAQDLAELLPEETFLALGMQDLESASAQLEDFSAEFKRLDVMGALTALSAGRNDSMSGGAGSGGMSSGGAASGGAGSGGMGSGGAGLSAAGVMGMDDLPEEAQQALETLGSLEVLGQEAWIALSASSFSPLPALTMITRVTPEGAEQVRALLSEAGTKNTEELEESGTPFFQIPLNGAEPLQVLAYALTDDLLVLSTNPDELRGVLRRLGGADEPNFAGVQGYKDTLATLDSGTFYSFFDYARIADTVEPFLMSGNDTDVKCRDTPGNSLDCTIREGASSFAGLVGALSKALRTAGAVGSVIRLTDDGLVTESFQSLNRDGGDASLYALLSADTAAATDVPVPEGALSYSSSAVDLSGWYDYLNELALTVPELGGDLDSLVLSLTGLNLRESIFSWTGEQLVSVTTGLSEVVEPGVPSENLLGEAAYLIETTNEAAAQRGLGALLQNLSRTVSSLADPQGGAGEPQSEQQTLAGVDVTRFDFSPGATVFYAVNGGYALIATSEDAMTQALTAQTDGGRDNLFSDLPNSATTYTYTDNQATFASLGERLSSQLQTAAGMGGASGLDFEAVEAASNVAEKFLAFVATRLTDATSYSERVDGGVRTYSEAAVDWKE